MPTTVGTQPTAMTLAELAAHSAREISKYRRKEASNSQFSLEIFHRAILQNEDAAWELVQQQFGEYVRYWLGRHPYTDMARRIEPEEKNYVDDTFYRFWMAVREQRIVFSSLAAALNYLHLCLHCTIMDTLRARVRQKLEPLPIENHPDEPTFEDRYHEGELWEVINQLLPTEREKRLAYLHFYCNLKPRQIVHYCPLEFEDEREVYKIKRNVVERLMRNADIIRWKLALEPT